MERGEKIHPSYHSKRPGPDNVFERERREIGDVGQDEKTYGHQHRCISGPANGALWILDFAGDEGKLFHVSLDTADG